MLKRRITEDVVVTVVRHYMAHILTRRLAVVEVMDQRAQSTYSQSDGLKSAMSYIR